ncbi:Ubiquitin-conjugating enzyme [Carpediemonas membranifera]|uniref:Ubiquitin-conjugating enzyme n=1 Tax=Carpediemonas membranifera TaxID=201153 RepID=A0A8J6B463_9EUKA|nr:Ubiquitin-conjugating enzyme [Carpediemonas membranifera]|eukprot:KAG9389667.1 Ubiquitin-conjugating enzyme [Carpediemonas membranifera]
MILVVPQHKVTRYVWFDGPKESPYEGGRWKVHVQLPENYPFLPPNISFASMILHPNTAVLMLKDQKEYAKRVKEHMRQHGTLLLEADDDADTDDATELSDVSSADSSDDLALT